MERSASAVRRAQRERRQQLLEAARSRYPALSYQEKGALVDELVELSGFHRKSVLRLLRQQPADHGGPSARADAGHDSAEVGGKSLRYGPCWPMVLPWLMADPLPTGQQAMYRLEQEHPGLYLGSLRT